MAKDHTFSPSLFWNPSLTCWDTHIFNLSILVVNTFVNARILKAAVPAMNTSHCNTEFAQSGHLMYVGHKLHCCVQYGGTSSLQSCISYPMPSLRVRSRAAVVQCAPPATTATLHCTVYNIQ